MKEKVSVDIIIPIYNAFEELNICLESVKKYTDLSTNRLILINDNSSDTRIADLLEKEKDVLVITNEVNKGFAENINIGIKISETNDVIMLNSDTEVTEGWLDKIINCAYSAEDIGTVTPLSNNATICSVPAFCRENTLPPGLDVQQMGRLVETCSLNRYPDISVGHGFCMYIKRSLIKEIGLFDSKTFERGYGEENDFCYRANKAGFRNVMCDNTYIYHSGTKSFLSEEKKKNIREHEQILIDRYPHYVANNKEFIRTNPVNFVGENIDIYLEIIQALKNNDNKNPFKTTCENGKNIVKLVSRDKEYCWIFKSQASEDIKVNLAAICQALSSEIIKGDFDAVKMYEGFEYKKCTYSNSCNFSHERLVYDKKIGLLKNVAQFIKFKIKRINSPVVGYMWEIVNNKKN